MSLKEFISFFIRVVLIDDLDAKNILFLREANEREAPKLDQIPDQCLREHFKLLRAVISLAATLLFFLLR